MLIVWNYFVDFFESLEAAIARILELIANWL